ncbi:hypothetical protein [Micromonospora inaquosa]|nr:hypothetical protein [Micromonospora inaquosa]
MLLVLAQPPVSSDSGWTQWVPVASAAVALLALLVALSNRNTSRRALALSMQQEERRAARLDVTLADSASWRRSGASRWVGIKILAVNPTDRDAAIVGAELHIAYTLPTGHAMTVKVGHRTTGDDFPGDVTALDLPVRLESNGAVAGWLTFELPAGLFPHGAGIQRYDAVLQDSRGIAVTVSASVLREVEHDQTSDDQAADETSGRSR